MFAKPKLKLNAKVCTQTTVQLNFGLSLWLRPKFRPKRL